MNRKMKINKAFTPLASDEGDEFFPNGIFEFNITKLLAFIRENPTKFTVEVLPLPALPYQGSAERLNEDTIGSADVSRPIILAEISPGRFNVIDGHHRIERARRDGVDTIPAYRAPAEEHIAFQTTVRGYEAYVKYWNEKLREASE